MEPRKDRQSIPQLNALLSALLGKKISTVTLLKDPEAKNKERPASRYGIFCQINGCEFLKIEAIDLPADTGLESLALQATLRMKNRPEYAGDGSFAKCHWIYIALNNIPGMEKPVAHKESGPISVHVFQINSFAPWDGKRNISELEHFALFFRTVKELYDTAKEMRNAPRS